MKNTLRKAQRRVSTHQGSRTHLQVARYPGFPLTSKVKAIPESTLTASFSPSLTWSVVVPAHVGVWPKPRVKPDFVMKLKPSRSVWQGREPDRVFRGRDGRVELVGWNWERSRTSGYEGTRKGAACVAGAILSALRQSRWCLR